MIEHDASTKREAAGADDASTSPLNAIVRLPSPYFDRDGITIYHGDCRELRSHLRDFDLLLTDPPYGIAHFKGNSGNDGMRATRKTCRRNATKVEGDDKPFDPREWLDFKDVILWGANHYASRLPDSGRWLAWDKLEGTESFDSFSDVEFCWHNNGKASRLFRYLWKGVLCRKEGEDNGRRWHPTQKPLGLMKWCLGLVPEAATVLDPFMGSGTTLVAAKLSGLRAVGVEIDERYCEIAAERLRQGVLF